MIQAIRLNSVRTCKGTPVWTSRLLRRYQGPIRELDRDPRGTELRLSADGQGLPWRSARGVPQAYPAQLARWPYQSTRPPLLDRLLVRPFSECGSAGAPPSPRPPFRNRPSTTCRNLNLGLAGRLVRSPDVFARVGRIDRSVEGPPCA